MSNFVKKTRDGRRRELHSSIPYRVEFQWNADCWTGTVAGCHIPHVHVQCYEYITVHGTVYGKTVLELTAKSFTN